MLSHKLIFVIHTTSGKNQTYKFLSSTFPPLFTIWVSPSHHSYLIIKRLQELVLNAALDGLRRVLLSTLSHMFLPFLLLLLSLPHRRRVLCQFFFFLVIRVW
ncbi:hypothetical protein, unlikely [Trypanosoma brucei gambiense DAL972]|uniref:Uncharacterized protein n=1 Tax=Trypanosoma brucei gambiense (strain MHOM/CI/86/DAL972) TaxID=679716 RepID=C9ZQT7_TRYB9|nr:hypothetical protein, unlikely [Trypanosoma brucei gambiense DAL972]CBH11767.1 hypothetical protein, unlikely [Trypanosoma brucei gambiense DAL972]|eukprot:XP_011774052.1 hypothetical protein, unlikely [Trypanosoma brucei gambiense DAL972]